jgi:RimJ/RimL family protein N-acetyltransferase
MVQIVSLSGYRLNKEELPPEQKAYRWATLRNEVQKYSSLLTGLDAAYYLDDGDRNIPIVDLLMAKLHNGEVYFVFTGESFVGIAAICNIAWDRHGYIEAIATPAYRNGLIVGRAMGEILTYAFRDYGDIKNGGGLGLKKLKATVSIQNISVAQMLANAGFKPLTVLPAEGLYGGVPHDMILLEMGNPKYFQVNKDIISDERSTESSNLSNDTVHEPAAVSPSSEHDERARDNDGSTTSGSGQSDNGSRSELAEPEQLQWDTESISTGGTRRSLRPTTHAADGELVQSEHNSAPSVASPVTDATKRPKLRELWPGDGGPNTGSGEPERVHIGTGS